MNSSVMSWMFSFGESFLLFLVLYFDLSDLWCLLELCTDGILKFIFFLAPSSFVSLSLLIGAFPGPGSHRVAMASPFSPAMMVKS